jgi:hypothetical protein
VLHIVNELGRSHFLLGEDIRKRGMVIEEQRPMREKSAYLKLLMWCLGLHGGCNVWRFKRRNEHL